MTAKSNWFANNKHPFVKALSFLGSFFYISRHAREAKHPKLRLALSGLTVGYILFLAALQLAIIIASHRIIFLDVLLFLPSWGWLLPLILLSIPALIFAPRLLIVNSVTMVVFFVLVMDYQPRNPASRFSADADLRVVSNNTAQAHGYEVDDYIKSVSPHIVLLQASKGRIIDTESDFNNLRHVERSSGYLVYSEYPIKDVEIIPYPVRLKPIGIRVVVDYKGHDLVLYNVHLPTPRETYIRLKGKGIFKASNWRSCIRNLRARRYAIVTLTEMAEQEDAPTIVVGDFNTPSHGRLYRHIASRLTDSHTAAGSGFGYTVPGYLHSKLFSPFAPWLRIDYIFYRGPMKADFADVDRNSTAQHRTISAGFSFTDWPLDDSR